MESSPFNLMLSLCCASVVLSILTCVSEFIADMPLTLTDFCINGNVSMCVFNKSYCKFGCILTKRDDCH